MTHRSLSEPNGLTVFDVESFFPSLEYEPPGRTTFKTKTEAQLAVFTDIEGWSARYRSMRRLAGCQ